MEVSLFEQVGDAVRSLLPEELGGLHMRSHRRGIKVWFGAGKPPREHYEAQIIARRHVDGTDGMAIEIGFHAEHKEAERNIEVAKELKRHQKSWRNELGKAAELGVFLGADNWRRLSEVWIEPDLDDPELPFEIAACLVDYLAAVQPVLSPNGSNA